MSSLAGKKIYIQMFDSVMERHVWVNVDHIISFHEADAENKRVFKCQSVLEMTDGRTYVTQTVEEIADTFEHINM